MSGTRASKGPAPASSPAADGDAAPRSAGPHQGTELEAIADATSATRSAQVESSLAAASAGGPAVGGLALGWLLGDGEVYEVRTAAGVFPARLDGTLHPAVAETARCRKEAVLVTRAADGTLVVVGALRTSPTPGVDEVEEISLTAKRIRIEATEDVQIKSGIAQIAVRAVGEVETYADRIMSRAEEVQKIVARMLRLN